jgi:hypothetical protein
MIFKNIFGTGIKTVSSDKFFALVLNLRTSTLKMTKQFDKTAGFEMFKILADAEERERQRRARERQRRANMAMGMTGMVGISFFA